MSYTEDIQKKYQVTISNKYHYKMIKKFQWSYKVFSSDSNYNERTDKFNDWFDYDQHLN